MAATLLDWQPADSDNNLLRKMLTRLNSGIIVDAIHIGDISISQPLGVFPDPAGAVWKVEANATLPVSGTVAVSNFPATQPVSGTVGVNNFPATQPVSGTVAVSNFPATQPVSFAQPITATVTPSGSGTQPVSGTVAVSNFPATQPVSGTVGVNNFPASQPVSFSDSASVDAFSRLRIASPTYLFDSQLTYEIPHLVYESVTNGSGAAVAHDATNRCATCTFASTPTGGKAFLQTFEFFRYQPGRSQEIFLTFNFIETAANVLKFAGYSDGTNGVELQQNGSTVQLVLLSGTANGNQTVAKTAWNIDKLDGTGISGKTLDLTKTQILVIDLQALYVGRVRVGFDIDGVVVPVHQFTHANKIAVPYIQTANLPIRCGMTCTGTVSTTMQYICSSVSSGGGQEDSPGFSNTVEGTGTAGNGTAAHILSLRPALTYNGIVNRSVFILESAEFVVTGNNPVSFEIVIGQVISGTTAFTAVNAGHSSMEFNTAGTISGGPHVTLAGGYVAATASSKSSGSFSISHKFPISLDAAGAVRADGTVSVIATGIGGTSACRARLNWRELR